MNSVTRQDFKVVFWQNLQSWNEENVFAIMIGNKIIFYGTETVEDGDEGEEE